MKVDKRDKTSEEKAKAEMECKKEIRLKFLLIELEIGKNSRMADGNVSRQRCASTGSYSVKTLVYTQKIALDVICF